MLSKLGLDIANAILKDSSQTITDPEIFANYILGLEKHEIQEALSLTNSEGKTAVQILIANLLRFAIKKPSLEQEHAANITARLKAINILTAQIDNHDYLNKIKNFTKLKPGIQYLQLKEVERGFEQVLICLKAILETNLRIRPLVQKTQALSDTELGGILPPIIIIHNDYEDAARKFFSGECLAFAKSENITALCLEQFPANAEQAIAAIGLDIKLVDYLPAYVGEEAAVWQEAASKFNMQSVFVRTRGRVNAHLSVLTAIESKGRVMILSQPFEAERIIKDYCRITKTNCRVIVLADAESVPESVRMQTQAYAHRYKQGLAKVEKIYTLETLNYSHRNEWFEKILIKGRFELNYIWVGKNTMPISQRVNLLSTKALNPNSVVQIWTISRLLNEEMQQFVRANNLQLVEIDALLDQKQYPTTFELVTLLQTAKTLWAALADILKFLILTRHLEDSSLAKRYYLEADNLYLENFSILAKELEFLHQYAENMLGKREFANVDSYYLNVATPLGKKIQAIAAGLLEQLLADPKIYKSLKKIIETDISLGFSREDVVVNSFGTIPSTLCKGLFLALGMNFKDFADPKFGSQFYERRSWLSAKAKQKFYNSTQLKIIRESVAATNALTPYFKNISSAPAYWTKIMHTATEEEENADKDAVPIRARRAAPKG